MLGIIARALAAAGKMLLKHGPKIWQKVKTIPGKISKKFPKKKPGPTQPCPAGKCPPKQSPKFQKPTNPPQNPPKNVPEGWRVREMPPTQQYPKGYWKLEKPMSDGSWQPINPSTMKPGTRPETHIEFP